MDVYDGSAAGRGIVGPGQGSSGSAASKWRDVSAESSEGGPACSYACRDGTGGSGFAWHGDVRFIWRAEADDYASIATENFDAPGGSVELFPIGGGA